MVSIISWLLSYYLTDCRQNSCPVAASAVVVQLESTNKLEPVKKGINKQPSSRTAFISIHIFGHFICLDKIRDCRTNLFCRNMFILYLEMHYICVFYLLYNVLILTAKCFILHPTTNTIQPPSGTIRHLVPTKYNMLSCYHLYRLQDINI